MCEAKPGPRCASDTCENAALSSFEYAETYPAGPAVDPLAAVESRYEPETTSTGTPTQTYDISPDRLAEAQAKIAQANKRLERAGISERFELSVEPYVARRQVPTGFGRTITQHEERLRVTVNHPELSYGGWTFVAALDETEAGMVARTAPGQSLDGWRPDGQLCEHCGKARHRTSTYALRHTDGTIRQVGSGCLSGFLGVKPSGLWALEYDLDLEEDAPSRASHTASTGRQVTPARDLIATTLAVSDGGKDYVSRTRSETTGRTATASTVSWALNAVPATSQDADEQEAIAKRAQQYLTDGTVDEVIAHARALDGDSDYATNMRTIMAGEWVSPRHTGLAVSAVGSWMRARERAAERASTASGFLAPVGQKVADVPATVTKVAHFDSAYGTRSLVVMRSADGHVTSWMSSKRQPFEPGTQVIITGGTVKNHTTYRGIDQTELTRVKLVEARAEPTDV